MKKILIGFLLLFLLSSCFGKMDKNETEDKKTQENINNNLEQKDTSSKDNLKNSKNNLDSFLSYLSEDEFKKFKDFSNSGDFDKSNEYLDKILLKLDKENLTSEERKIKKSAYYLKMTNILNKGTYFYDELNSSKDIKKLISEIQEKDGDILDSYYLNYYLGYADEITKNYTGSLNHYNKSLNILNKDDIKNNEAIGFILNQIGHLYDLKGETQKAYDKYEEAYKYYPDFPEININLGRVYFRGKEYKIAKTYFEKALKKLGNNKVAKSELYFTLASLELELNGLNPDIEKSIEYSKKSIENYSKYPMGYLSLAKGYYMLNDKKYLKDIEKNLFKSIELNPNGYRSYELLGLLWNDFGNIEEADKYLMKAFSKLDKDMILMDNEREYLKNQLAFQSYLIKNTFNLEIYKLDLDSLMKNDTLKRNIRFQLQRKNNGIFGEKGEIFEKYFK